MFPMNGNVGGPGGNFRGRRLARKYLERVATTTAMKKHRLPIVKLILPENFTLCKQTLSQVKIPSCGLSSR
jgi:hypothetical protein